MPALDTYRNGNAGIPYVLSFAAAEPGPHAVLTALIHGNEAGLSPAQAAERLVAKATVDAVMDPKGSANRLPYVGKEE